MGSSSLFADAFGFLVSPFDPAPDPRFAYASSSFADAIREVVSGPQRGEWLRVVTGPSGCGKSMLCRVLPQHLVDQTFVVVIGDPPATADDFARRLLAEFGLAADAAKGPGGVAVDLRD